ncbi:MAG: copper-translocating P-type ATPase [Acidimicrobiia bacterium]|nr:copper-translocating P-type ATPase [Acidimicrobiia bacterium]
MSDADTVNGHKETHAGHDNDAGHGGHGTDHTGHEEMFRQRFWVCLVLSVPVLVWSDTIQEWFGYAAPHFPGSHLIVPVLATAVFAYGGIPFIRMAIPEVRDRAPGMMTLISLAILVAYGYSMAALGWQLGADFFWELVSLIDVMLLGHWLEMRSVRQASGALDALAELMPDTAEVVTDDGDVVERPVDELSVGDVVLIRPGASAPADATVVDGASKLDESMITGESTPIDAEVGQEVIAGTVNVGDSSLRAEVSAIGDDTTLAGIMRLVSEAQASKSPTQLVADRAASFLFYAAVGAAAVTAVVWTIVDGGVSERMVARVVTVLVIACPHALGLAIPLVVAITTKIAAENGTLIRNREAIDTARRVNVLAIDKTGTLTEGRIGLVAVATTDGIDEDTAITQAASVEGDSEHLIARALRGAADDRQLTRAEVTDFAIEKGRGVGATLDGMRIEIGGPRLLDQRSFEPDRVLASFASDEGDEGRTVVYMVRDGDVVAAVSFADVIRDESAAAIAALHGMGVKVVMITGDSESVAASVAADLAIDEYRAEVLPEEKDRIIADLKGPDAFVAMVGDGVNDAPALARADIGIAIGSGTDVAVESADLVLVKSNPLDIVRILRLSAAAYHKQVQNIWWAAGYNIVMIPLAAGVLAPWGLLMPPAVGALLMSLSTIIVAANAQLLRKVDLENP